VFLPPNIPLTIQKGIRGIGKDSNPSAGAAFPVLYRYQTGIRGIGIPV